jgi:hypothetical protein
MLDAVSHANDCLGVIKATSVAEEVGSRWLKAIDTQEPVPPKAIKLLQSAEDGLVVGQLCQ